MRFTRITLAAALFAAGSLQAHADTMLVFDLPTITRPVELPSLKDTSDLVTVDGLALGSVSATSKPVAVTPEPSSVILLATGLLTIAGGLARRHLKGRGQAAAQPASSAAAVFAGEFTAVAST